MGANGRARVLETYSTDAVVRRYEELFGEIAAAHQ
jgi:hypothetical protein